MEKQPDLQPSPPLRRGSPINGMIPPRPFKKGQSGNPKGYSKKKKLLIEFRDYFEQHPEKWDAMITVAIKAAEKGEFQYWNALVERVKGKVPQKGDDADKKQAPIIIYNVIDNVHKEKIENLHKTIDDE